MAKNNKPSLTGKQSPRKPLIPQRDAKDLPFLTFSFRYFGQILPYFGYKKCDSAWFANLHDRLKDLSGKTSRILEDRKEREAYRLHPIDWNSPHCPISIDDLKSIPDSIRKNAEKDFIWQFQLSKGTGRVVGFFNESYSVFYIVLLDPAHNIQPSKDFGYKLDNTEFAMTEYEELQTALVQLEEKRQNCESYSECPLSSLSDAIIPDCYYAKLDSSLVDTYQDLITTGKFQDLFDDFLLQQGIK